MRRLALALTCLLAAVPIAGSAPTAQAEAPRPLLWKVSDADNHVYLLGSFHLLRKSDYPLSRDVDAALADAEAVAFEVTPTELNDPALGARLMQRATSGRQGSLARTASPALLASLHGRVSAMGLPANAMDGFEPWFVGVTLVTVVAQQMGFSPDDGLDRHLMKRAAELGKPITGLESIDSQLDMLESTPVAEQLASLEDFTKERDGGRRELEALHSAWRRGDEARLETLAREEMQKRTPVSYRRVNVDRNRAWMPKLQAMLARGRGQDALVVVGALHLVGRDGLPALLRARGFRVERICTACGPRPLNQLPGR